MDGPMLPPGGPPDAAVQRPADRVHQQVRDLFTPDRHPLLQPPLGLAQPVWRVRLYGPL